MMGETTFVQPPRVPAWLVGLFISSEQTESLLGDLLEEFSELVSKSGIASACHWYWRQSAKTIVNMLGTGLRVAPWLIASSMVVGYLSLGVAYWSSERAVVAILYRYQVYAHVDAHTFWLLYAILIERLLEPFFLGCILAAVAKGREMLITLPLSIYIAATSGAGLLHSRPYWSVPNFQIMPLLVTTLLTPLALIVGGVIVREIRSHRSLRPSSTLC
jgi:hypothetical protein